jgi:hypothetical protein
MKAAWIWGIEDELAAADLPALAIRATTEPRTPQPRTADAGNPNRRNRPTAPTRNSAVPENEQTPSSKPGRSSPSSAAALARRHDRQSHPGIASPRDQIKMKKAHCAWQAEFHRPGVRLFGWITFCRAGSLSLPGCSPFSARRFAVCASGLACGLALAVRPAGSLEAQRARSGALAGGGGGPDNARRSVPPLGPLWRRRIWRVPVGLVLTIGHGCGSYGGNRMRPVTRATGRGSSARPAGFRPKGETEASAPPTVRRPALTPAAYGGALRPLISSATSRAPF